MQSYHSGPPPLFPPHMNAVASSSSSPPPPPPPASTRLLQDFPSLSTCSETDIKDLLVDDRLADAVIQIDAQQVREALDEQERLAKENEEIASKKRSRVSRTMHDRSDILAEHNLSLQADLVALRTSTASAYATAQHLKDRWHEIEARQAAIYQVRRFSLAVRDTALT